MGGNAEEKGGSEHTFARFLLREHERMRWIG